MKRLALIATCAALHAFAEGPGDFASSAPLTPAGGDALQRFALPFEAYRDARRDLADVRVYNGAGEPVPIARAAGPASEPETPRTVELAQFAVSTLAPPSSAGGTEVTIRMTDGTLVEVRGRGRAAKSAVPVAWLLDASQVKEPLRALVFEWDAAPGTETVRVNVDGSDDLESWRPVGRASLLKVTQAGRVLEQRRAAITPGKSRYYRVTWAAGKPFTLRRATGELEPSVKPPRRSIRTVAAKPGSQPGEFVFDLGARLPVEAWRVVLAEPNWAATFTLLARDTAGGDWRPVSSATFYRLVRDATQLQSPPLEIARHPAREWMLRVDPQSGGIGNASPSLEVQGRSDEIVFVTRGDPPFRLAFGNPDAKPAWVPVSTLIPNYQRDDERKLGEALVGPVSSGPVRASKWPAWAAEMGPRKLTLWAVLIAAVAVLGFMAWRLKRQLAGDARRPPA
jgi:hypothetical protein